jgi:hypothetical protein
MSVARDSRRGDLTRGEARPRGQAAPRRLWLSTSGRSFFRPLVSICRIRSRVSWNTRPTSSSVYGRSPFRPKRTRARDSHDRRASPGTSRARRGEACRRRRHGARRLRVLDQHPELDPSSSPTGISKETGIRAIRARPVSELGTVCNSQHKLWYAWRAHRPSAEAAEAPNLPLRLAPPGLSAVGRTCRRFAVASRELGASRVCNPAPLRGHRQAAL